MCGKLELIIGPMFSGKSTELIRRIKLLQKINKSVLVLKPKIDNRYVENKISSHNYDTADCVVIEKLEEINIDEKNYDVIIIDEGQFFPDLLTIITYWTDNYNVNIIVAGLDGDFNRKPIGDILKLIPYADKCKKINSLCTLCLNGTKAPFSHRTIQSEEQVLVGGADLYQPLCRKHYLSK